MALEKEYFENAKEKDLSKNLVKYVWYDLISLSKGYSFNCLVGSTVIKRPSDNNRFVPTIEEAYKIMNDFAYAKETNHYCLRKNYFKRGYGTALSLFEDKRIRKNTIADIAPVGIKPVYTITTDRGHTITCTENHKFPTPNGERRVYQLAVGDELYYMEHYKKSIPAEITKIVSIEPAGEQMVYDVSMSDPAHNFVIDNGLITSNSSHTLAYSLIGLQELNIVYKYGALYWNTANLIVDSGSLNEDGNTDYGKIATAIATMQSNNIKVELPLINTAEKNFVPDSEHNRIMYSLKAINGVGDNDIAAIIANRPFKDLNDFCTRMIETKIIKNSTMVSMIKAGCFDKIDGEYRKRTMDRYLKRYVFTQRESLTMSNIPAMQSLGIIPERFKEIVRYTGFKNYILSEDFLVENVIIPNKKVPKCGYHDRLFKLNDVSMPYFKEHFSEDSIERVEGDKYVISEKKIVKEIEIIFDPVREWLKSSEAVDLFNDATYKEIWDKHAKGTLSRWDMQALSYYYHKHELADLDLREYGVVDYYKLPRTPKVYDSFVRYVNNERIVIPKYEIVRIAGTVLNADNPHYTVTLATTTGVVKVKFNKGQYAYYNRQISAYLNGESKKTVLDKPWFRRGTLLLVCGYRQDDNFRAYRYKETIYLHTVSIIDEINEDGTLKLRSERNDPNGTED